MSSHYPCIDGRMTCEGELAAGEHRAAVFDPPFTYTVLDDEWLNPEAQRGNFLIIPGAATTESEGIYVYRDPAIWSQDPGCPERPEPGIGRTVQDLVDWIGHHPGLVIKDLTDVELGGLPGKRFDLTLDPAWTTPCPFSQTVPFVPMFIGTGVGGFAWGLNPTTHMRLHLLDAGSGRVVMIDEEAQGAEAFAMLVERADPIVASFDFEG